MSNSQDNNDLPDNEYEGEDIANESTQAAQETEVVAEVVDSDSEVNAEAESETQARAEETAAAESEECDQEANKEGNSESVVIPNLAQIIEGAVLAADKPLSIDHIIQLFPDHEPSRKQVRDAIAEIQEAVMAVASSSKRLPAVIVFKFELNMATGSADFGKKNRRDIPEHYSKRWRSSPTSSRSREAISKKFVAYQ